MKSSAQLGTLYQLRNKLGRSNVVCDPKKDFNACDDFIRVVISSHMVAVTLQYLQMESISDIPHNDSVLSDPDLIWMKTVNERKRILMDVCKSVVDEYIDFQYHQNSAESDSNQPDKVMKYGKELLRLGCFYLEFSDAIKEGDGIRVIRCWRYLLPIFLASSRTNYSTEALTLLFQIEQSMSPRLKQQLIWSRFINVHGRPGKNIPMDLHMEHLNAIAKGAIKNLGSGKTEKAIVRAGRAIGTLSTILSQFDEDNKISRMSGVHRIEKYKKDVEIIVKELQRAHVFSRQTSSRKHHSFPNPKDILHSKSKDEIKTWIKTKMSQMK